MQFAAINGISIHFEDSGERDRPAMVFVNALATDLRIWDKVLPEFQPAYRTVRYDKRGHGLSDATDAPYRIQEHVADLTALLDHLGITRAILCGVSVGGLIAQGVYADRPDLVRAMVICATAHRIGNATCGTAASHRRSRAAWSPWRRRRWSAGLRRVSAKLMQRRSRAIATW